MSQRPEDDYFSIHRLNQQLEECIEHSKEMTRRSQELLDRQRSGQGDPPQGEVEDGGQAA